MYTALYRKYRPGIFSEILGQEHIIRILKNQISAGTVSHAYLFCGTRGTGKTTVARILAKGVNCTSEKEKPCGVCENCRAIRDGVFMDVIEIDAASHNGVDNIRELRESVKYPPATGSKKVYIIDEVHMLSTGAFNALLKTLEEPPEHIMFILATTEPQKLPATILSRCMRLDFRRVSENLLKAGMEKICTDIGASVSESALKLIAVNADGSVRDGLSILDQCLASGEKKVTRDDVLSFLGTSGEEVYIQMTDSVAAGKVDEALLFLDKVLADGKDVRQFMKDWLAHYRNLLIVKFIKDAEDILNLSCENTERIREQSEGLALPAINRSIVEISKLTAEARWSTQPRILLELCIVNLAVPEETAAVPATRMHAPAKKAASAAAPMQAKKTVLMEEPAERAVAAEEHVSTNKAQGEEALWGGLFEGEGCLTGSFNVIRGGSKIKTLSDTECVIAAQSEIIKEFIEKNRGPIEDLLEARTGVRRAVKSMTENKRSNETKAKTTYELAEELKNKLGICIEIEE